MGGLLARAGHTVVTGGYGGVMEAACAGAAEAGGRTVGVTCDIFEGRRPNRYLGQEIRTAELFERTRRLIDLAGGYVVLHGKSGTLAELALLWALDRAGCLDRRPVVLLGDGWSALLAFLQGSRMLETAQQRITQVADTPEQAMSDLTRLLAGTERD